MVTAEICDSRTADSVSDGQNILNVLNRDQRTALTIDRSRGGFDTRRNLPGSGSQDHRVPVDSFQFSNSVTASVGKFIRRIRSHAWGLRRRRRLSVHQWTGRLGEVFVVGVCLLTLVRVPGVMSAPSTRFIKATEKIHSHQGGHKAPKDPRNYMHPCWDHQEEQLSKYFSSERESELEMGKYFSSAKEVLSDSEIINRVIITAMNALSAAEDFRDDYVNRTFGQNFTEHHSRFADRMYLWLPNEGNGIPKRLGENVDRIHLESQVLSDSLIIIFEHLQKFAVALEQVVKDQKENHGEFQEKFRNVEVLLLNVLCELRTAMIEKNLTPRGHVPRSIMKDEIRKIEHASQRNLRDWYIYRDLMNSLEYTIQVFTFIKENLLPSTASSS